MKKGLALILALLMLGAALPALGEGYTLEEKFYQQAWKESAYRGTVTFAATGDSTAAMDSALWTVIKQLAPRLSLTIEHTTTRTADEGQANLTLTVDGKESAKASYLYDEKLSGFSSSLLSADNAVYTAARTWDLTRLIQSAAQGENAWPPVWRLILAVMNAPEEWKNRAGDYLNIYETKLGIWLQGYAEFTTGQENGIGYTQLACSIPGQAVKAEIEQLLVDFYKDDGLLTLLREIATPQEAAAYLQPSERTTLFSLLDRLTLNGSVDVVRRYDTSGQALLDQISFPFTEGSPVSALTISMKAQENGQERRYAGTLKDGTEFDITCLAGEDLIFTGSVEITLPEKQNASFVVSEGAGEKQTIAFDYNLMWAPGEDQYSLADDRMTRAMEGSLLIKPRGESKVPEQSITLDATLSSGSSQRSSTQLNATLTWRDMDSDATVTAALISRTVSPFAYTTPSSVLNAVRLDLMTQESRAALIGAWQQRLALYASQLLGNSMVNLFSTTQQ